MTIRSEPAGPMAETVFNDLCIWLEQAIKSGDPDNNRLLLSGMPEWAIGPVAQPTLAGPDKVYLLFKKPKEEEELTLRLFDLPLLFCMKLHCVAGGRAYVEAHGPKGDYYYSRLQFPGHRTGDNRRCYISRLIAGTAPGDLTEEGTIFADMRRSQIGWRSRTPDDSASEHGREAARRWTLDAIHKAVDRGVRLPAGVTAERIGDMLDEGYRLLDQVPLGFDHRQQP